MLVAASPPGTPVNKIVNLNKKEFNSILRCSSEEPLVHLSRLKSRVFMQYILSLRKEKENSYLGESSYSHKRSSLNHLFRVHNGNGYDADYKELLIRLFKGFNRKVVKLGSSSNKKPTPTTANRRKKDDKNDDDDWEDDDDVPLEDINVRIDSNVKPRVKTDSGKAPMGVELYQKVAEWFLAYGTMDGIFAHTFLLFTWNLACRSHNTAQIKVTDITWNCSFDSFHIYFSHTKIDQTGENSRYPRHIFSNPHDPNICPIFSLAMYAQSCFNSDQLAATGMLFPGEQQQQRFGKMLAKILREHRDEVTAMGYDVENLGTHSIRKGASTYLTSLPGGPSVAATCIRGGWTMGHIKDRYFRYFDTGDQFVGRCLALLNIHSFEFACSPAFFDSTNETDDGKINDVCCSQFPVLSKVLGFGKICRMCLASLVYHRRWMSEHLDMNHVVNMTSEILRNNEEMDKIRNIKVVVTYAWSDKKNTFAGVPPHISMMNDLSAIRTEQSSFISSFVDKVRDAINECAPGALRLTEERLNNILDRFSNESQIQFDRFEKKVAMMGGGWEKQNNNNDTIVETEEEKVARGGYKPHIYGGKFHRVPKNWRPPRCGVRGL